MDQHDSVTLDDDSFVRVPKAPFSHLYAFRRECDNVWIASVIHNLIHFNGRLFRHIDEAANDPSRDSHSDAVCRQVGDN